MLYLGITLCLGPILPAYAAGSDEGPYAGSLTAENAEIMWAFFANTAVISTKDGDTRVFWNFAGPSVRKDPDGSVEFGEWHFDDSDNFCPSWAGISTCFALKLDGDNILAKPVAGESFTIKIVPGRLIQLLSSSQEHMVAGMFSGVLAFKTDALTEFVRFKPDGTSVGTYKDGTIIEGRWRFDSAGNFCPKWGPLEFCAYAGKHADEFITVDRNDPALRYPLSGKLLPQSRTSITKADAEGMVVPPAKLDLRRIPTLLFDNTIVYGTREGEVREYFEPSGITLRIYPDGSKVSGTWRLSDDDTLCAQYEASRFGPGGETCSTIRVHENELLMIVKGDYYPLVFRIVAGRAH